MKLIIALLIALLTTGPTWAQQTQPFSCASTAPGNVNVREGPEEGAAIVAIIPSGGSVTGAGYDESGQWLNVITAGQTGWASAQFFSCETPTEPVEVPTVLITATSPEPVEGFVTATTAASPELVEGTTPIPTSSSATDAPVVGGKSAPTLCVHVFEDLNANGLRDDGDGTPQAASFALDGEAVSGCSSAVAGLHVIEVSMPAGRQASISARWNVSVRSGQLVALMVGAASPDALTAHGQMPDTTPAVPGALVMAGVGGLLIVVVGAGWLFTRRKNA